MLGSHRSGSTIYNHRIGEVQHVHGTLESQMVFGVNDESQIAKPDIFECDFGDIYEASFIKKQAMGVSGHSRKTLAGTNSGERTFCAAAHPADAWF